MKTNLYAQLLRPGRFFLWLAVCLIYLNIFVRLVPAAHRTGAGALQWWGFIVPLAVGAVLAMVLHEPMHRPFAMTLPGAKRRFFRSHLAVVGGAALLCALIAYLADRTLPVVAVIGIAAAGLTLALPVEPGWRWAGSRGLFWAILAAALSAAAFPREVRDFVVAHPWLSGASGVTLAALCCAVTFSPHRRRARANLPYTSQLTALFSGEFTSQRTTEALARQKISEAHWQSSLKGDSIVRWVRVVLHENFGQLRWGLTARFSIGGALMLAFVAFLPSKDLGPAERIQQVIGPHGGRDTGFLPLFLMLLILPQRMGLPRPEWLYPLSRARRAQVAFAASAWQLTAGFVLFVGGMILAAWLAARWAGLAFDYHAAAGFACSFALMIPFVPLSYWGRLHQNVRNDKTMTMLCYFLAVAAAISTGAIVGADWYSPGGLALCALAIVASQAAYYAALRHFYREGDLLQRGVTQQNFSLVNVSRAQPKSCSRR